MQENIREMLRSFQILCKLKRECETFSVNNVLEGLLW